MVTKWPGGRLIPRDLDTLDLDTLPVGELTKAWLTLVHDGLGQPVRVPLLVARGARPGPVAALTAAVHGNEVNGVPVLHRLLRKLDPQRLRGTLVAVPVANVPAYLLHQRRTDDGVDLNHVFPGAPVGREAVVYAHRFFESVVRQADLLLDLHTASHGRVNCLYVRADLHHAEARAMAQLQRPQIVVHSPPADGTLRGAANAAGVPAVTIEIGNPSRIQREFVKRSVTGLRAVLAHRGMLPRRDLNLGEPPVLCRRSGWLFTDRGGFLEMRVKLTERVHAGQEVAVLYDAFGEVVQTYTAPHDGIVIGHSVDPVASTGARILHLGEVASPGEFEEA